MNKWNERRQSFKDWTKVCCSDNQQIKVCKEKRKVNQAGTQESRGKYRQTDRQNISTVRQPNLNMLIHTCKKHAIRKARLPKISAFPKVFHINQCLASDLKKQTQVVNVIRVRYIWLKAVRHRTKKATEVNNRKKCATPVAVVRLPAATHPSFSMWHYYLSFSSSACLLFHLSHIFYLLLLAALVSLYHTSLSVSLYFLSLLCLACFIDCRSPQGRKNCRASACPSACYVQHWNSSSRAGKEK